MGTLRDMNERINYSLWKRSIYLNWGLIGGTWSKVSCNEDIKELVKKGSGEGRLSP
jgi:hypothetical protein